MTQLGLRPGRITALDSARGLFLIASVTTAAVLAPRADWLTHAAWTGVTFYDIIFPLFVTLSGCGLAFAYRNRVSARTTARRVTVLAITGLLYNALTTGVVDLTVWRATGPLQVYAVLVGVVAVLHTALRTARAWAVVTLAVAAGYTVALRLWAQTCAGDRLTPTCNPSHTIDGALLGPHMYAGGALGHDPEGLVAILGAFVTISAGVVAGHLALGSRAGDADRGPVRLLVWAVFLLLAGSALGAIVEPMKRLWTPGFGLMAGSVGVVIFGAGFLLLDTGAGPRTARLRERLSGPFVALGRNSLLVYFGSHLLVALLQQSGDADGGPSLAAEVADVVALGGSSQWGFVLLNLALWWALALVLHRFRIYVHA